MIWSVAWRNIWRNKLRSTVIIAAIIIGIFSGVFSWAFYRGMVIQRVHSAILTESSHIQIHHKNYMTNPDQNFFIPDAAETVDRIDTLHGIKAVTRRLLVNGMITSAETGTGVKVFGINPDQESKVTNIWSKIMEGTYFKGLKKNPVVMGSKLAEKLGVKLRSRVVLTVQGQDGALTNALFRVEGIYKTSNSMYDEMNVFVRQRDIAGLMGFDTNSAHEIAVLLDDRAIPEKVAAVFRERLPDLEILTWKEIMPEVSLIEASMDMYMYFLMAIVLTALVFGIINTMLMAVLERFKELGMLLAVGMNKTRVFTMIILETVFLSLTGGVLGIIVGYLATQFFHYRGIDLSAFAQGYEKLGYESIVYPVPDLDICFKVALMVLFTGILAALYPAWKAIQFKPAEALRIDI